MRIGILTVSDLGAVGQRADTSGDAILAWAGERGYEVVVRSVVPDETDRIVVTTDDLEHAVRSNAALEAAGFQTTLASLDEARQAMRRDPPPPPDCLVVTGGLHESGAAQLLALARDRSISTLGLVEQTEPDAKGLAD